MPSPRRIGAPDAKNRTVLLDATEQLMPEKGHAAVSSRRVPSTEPSLQSPSDLAMMTFMTSLVPA